MGMYGTRCGFDSRCPTMEYMASYKRIRLSHKTDWDPLTVYFNTSSEKKENRDTVHAVSQFEDFFKSSIYDKVLEHQSDTTKWFINAVKITPGSIERISTAVVSNIRNYPPTAENISMKWGCSFTSANNTLRNKMQEWILSAVIPLTRRYHTYLLSQDLCRHRNRFYMDT